jgi:surface protein
MFESCESIPKIDVSSFDTSKVKSGRSMFFRCYAVKNIELNSSRFDTGNM